MITRGKEDTPRRGTPDEVMCLGCAEGHSEAVTAISLTLML